MKLYLRSISISSVNYKKTIQLDEINFVDSKLREKMQQIFQQRVI